ncbi:hypothetical protein BKA69DRAFT_1097132 [Paraphysoderma sedebokerense]|nr:hypothetical protein BKA69DRAFT_1097132 [Paraphysoderma sedebokerense]
MDAILEHEMNMLLQEAEQVAINPGVASNDSELPKGWFSATTPEGKVYYYNTETQESRWDKPSMPKQPSNYVAGSSSQQSFRASGTVRGTSFSNPAKITDAVDPAVNATSGANMPTKKPPMPNKLRALPATSSPNTYTSVRESSPTLKITPSIQQAFTTQSSPSNAIIAPGRSISDASTYTGSIDGKSKLTINTTIETNILTSASHLAPQKSAPSAFYGTGAPLSSSSTQLFKRSSAESLNSSALDEQARKRVESALEAIRHFPLILKVVHSP